MVVASSFKAIFRPSLLVLLLLMAGCAESSPNTSEVVSSSPNSRTIESTATSRKETPVSQETSSQGLSSQRPSSQSSTSSKPTTQIAAQPPRTETSSIDYGCESGTSIRVSYATNETATLEYEGGTVTLASKASGSGARYAGAGYIWWTKGAEGTLYRQANINSPEIQLESCSEGQDFAQGNSPSSPNATLDDTTINPLTNVGPITRDSSEGDLINLFGPENVEAVSIPVGEGFTVPGTRLFAGTPNEVDIEWKYDAQSPQRITIRRGGTNWQTPEGLRIGSSLTEVTQVNGGAFDITGFEWDYPGRTIGWQGGAIADTLQIDFRRTQDIPAENIPYGEGPYSSAEASMEQMGLVIEQISIRWD